MKNNKQFQIYLKDEDKTNEVIEYKCLGDKYSVTFTSGKVFYYNKDNVRVIESVLKDAKAKECLTYLQELSDKVGLEVECDNGSSINTLSRGYDNINYIDPHSLMAYFLKGKLDPSPASKKRLPIYPFGFNISQHVAVKNALDNNLSIIEGPPGTGKTQTILNIVAAAIMNGKSVAVVSSNNSATQNVLDKLKKYKLDFLVASLGNIANKKEFIAKQTPLPSMLNWKISLELEITLKTRLEELFSQLESELLIKGKISSLSQELSNVITEEGHFLKNFKTFNMSTLKQFINLSSANKALDLLLRLEKLKKPNLFRVFLSAINLFSRTNYLFYKILRDHSKEILQSTLQRNFYKLKIDELSDELELLKCQVCDFDSKMLEYSDISIKLFRAQLALRYSNKKRNIYTIDDLKKNWGSFLEDYPIVLSTTYSLRNSLSNDTSYDYVIIDEASQVDLCTAGLTLFCAKNAVVVGDLQQLPHVVDRKTAVESDKIFAKYKLSECYRYKDNSIISTLITLFPNCKRTLLREHYRCHPKIIEFCNKRFYNNQLIVLSEAGTQSDPLIIYRTPEGNHARGHVNQRQIDIITQEIIPKEKLNIADGSLGIVTPYRSQTGALQSAFANMSVKADTVDKFQGQENHVIILSTVDNEITEFTDNANRLNVAISRAKDQLIVVTNSSDCETDGNLDALVRYIDYNRFKIVESSVHSIFDYLYKHYDIQRKKILEKSKKVSDYDSENLMYTLISDVLKDKRFSSFDVALHVPLKMLLSDNKLLNKNEAIYASNDLTHVDFLIFNKFDKRPRLAIEVDGVKYHSKGSKQAIRDSMKDSILDKYNLKMLRFSTNGSSEREKLINTLVSI